jgi:RNA polymerase sigma factor (sigma-70 family)
MPSDADLLRHYAETGDQDAFARFVHAHVDLVYAAAFRQTRGDVHLAHDVTQVVFTSAAKKAAALGRHPVITAWLYQATRYAAITTLRSRSRREKRESAVFAMNDEPAETAPAPDWQQISPELDRIVTSLGNKDREAIVLRFFGGKSFGEIGGQLGLTEGAARMRVERALEKLRTQLARGGITSSCAALSALLTQQGVMAAPAGLGAAATVAALSAPAAGIVSSAAVPVLKFMTTAKAAASVATVIAVLSIASAVHEHRAARTAEQALNDHIAQERLAAAEEAKRSKASSTATATPAAGLANVTPAKLGPPSTQAAETTSTSAPADNVASARGARSKTAFGALLDLFGNPGMQKQTSIQTKIRLDSQYGALFKELGLPPSQLEQLKNLLVEKQMVGFDSMSAAHDQGLDPYVDPRGFMEAVGAAVKTVDNQIATLIGAPHYEKLLEYQKTVPARNTANSLQQALSYTESPLTDDQANRLVNVLGQHGHSLLPPDNPFAVINSDLGIVKLDEQGLLQAQSFLSSAQIAVLKEKIQQQSQLAQARQSMGR